MNPTLSRLSRVNSLSLNPVNSTSPTNTDPPDAESNPAAQCINVDFPDPDGPMIAVYSPFAKATVTSSNATTRVSPTPYTFDRPTVRAAAVCTAVATDPP